MPDCPVGDDLAVILAPSSVDGSLHGELAGLITDIAGPTVLVDGPTPSGMFRLRVAERQLRAALLDKVRTIQSRADFTIKVVGPDIGITPAAKPARASGPVRTNVVNASLPAAKMELGFEFELLGVRQAWTRTQGDKAVVVAIIDSGVNLRQPLLEQNIWCNAAVDDSHGADFSAGGWPGVAYRNAPNENHRHGTDAAFVAAGSSSAAAGCSGIAPHSTVMPVKFLHGASTQDFNLACAIEYAAVSGASIANVSYAISGAYPHATLRAIDYAASRDMLVVVAAGDDSGDLEALDLYPAALSLDRAAVPNQLVVMSARNDFSLWQTWSRKAVHIAAPFVARVPGPAVGGPDSSSGSSISAPYVAGVAALVKSLNPGWWTFARLRRHLIQSGTWHEELVSKSIHGKRVHAARAVHGPMQLLIPGVPVIWDASFPQWLRWAMRYDSDCCTYLEVEYLQDGAVYLRTIGSGLAQKLGLELDVSMFANTRGFVRLRSLGSDFRTDWMQVEIR